MNYRSLWQLLVPLYGEREAQAIARWVLDEVCGLSFTDLCVGKDTQISAQQQARLEAVAARLAQGEPVQYVLGKAVFGGREFHVAPSVLIPRPETEALCQWVVDEMAVSTVANGTEHHLLDIGTGSGCIAVTLALALPDVHVEAWDISEEALRTAQGNANRLGAAVDFRRQDILSAPPTDAKWDVIASNPPYIPQRERQTMHANVAEYEPSLALFVPDDDPLLFYRAIGSYALRSLSADGWLLVETHSSYAEAVSSLFSALGFRQTEQRNDPFGKPRFVRARP